MSKFNSIKGKKIGILGFAFKANTNDTRESPAIQICKDLLSEGAILRIHDPRVEKEQISNDLGVSSKEYLIHNQNEDLNNLQKWEKFSLDEELFQDTDALVILTEWEEYSTIDWKMISEKMRKPAWVFDSRSILVKEKIREIGLNLWRIGDGTL